MLKRELRVSRLLDLDYERYPSFGAAERERLACVLVRDGVHVLEIAIGTALDDATTKLGLFVGIVEIDDGERLQLGQWLVDLVPLSRIQQTALVRGRRQSRDRPAVAARETSCWEAVQCETLRSAATGRSLRGGRRKP